MSANDWKNEMDKMIDGFKSQAMCSLRNIKKCFANSGRPFNKNFRKYFLQISSDSLAAVFSKFEMESLFEALDDCGSIRADAQLIHPSSDIDVACNLEVNLNQWNDALCAPKDTFTTVTTIKRNFRIASFASMHRPNDIAAKLNERDQSYAGLLHDVVGEEREEWRLNSSVLLDSNETLAIDDESNRSLIKEEHCYAKIDHHDPIADATAGKVVDVESSVIAKARRSSVFPNSDEKYRAKMEFSLRAGDIDLNQECRVILEQNSLIELLAKSRPKSANLMKGRFKTERPKELRPCSSYVNTKKKQLKVHMPKRTNERPYRCNQCLKRFSQSRNLYRHMKMQCNDYSFNCARCSRGFTEWAKQQSHEERCKQRTYQCFICKNFQDAYKKNLIRHMRIHNREQ